MVTVSSLNGVAACEFFCVSVHVISCSAERKNHFFFYYSFVLKRQKYFAGMNIQIINSIAECPTEVFILFQPEQKDFQHSVWTVSDLTFTLMTRKAAASRSP